MTNLEHKIDSTLLSPYDVIFESEYLYKELTCTICNHLVIDAYQTYCGCKYCRQCIIQHLDDGHEYCRGGQGDCREEKLVLDYNVFRNPILDRRILKLKVICPYEFCGAIIEHGQMEKHMTDCPQRPIECPYSDIGCDCRMASREKIKTHLHTAMFTHSQLMVATINERRAKFDMSLEDAVNERIKCGEDQRNESVVINKEMNKIRSKMERDKSEATAREARRSEEMRALKAEVDGGRQRSEALETRRSEEMRSLNAEVDGGSQRSEALETRRSEEMRALKAEVDGGRQWLETLETRRSEEMRALKAEVDGGRQRLEALETRRSEDMRALKAEVDGGSQRLEALETRRSEEMRALKAEVDSGSQRSEALEARMSEEMRALKAEVEAGRYWSEELEGEVRKLKEEVKGAVEESMALRAEAGIMRARMDAEREEFRGMRVGVIIGVR